MARSHRGCARRSRRSRHSGRGYPPFRRRRSVRVVQRSGPVRPALEDGQIADLVGDLGDHLNTGGAGADNGDLLTSESTGSCGQLKVWKERPLKFSMPLRRGGVGVERRPIAMMTKRLVSSRPSSIFRRHRSCSLVEVRRFDLAVELHVFAQVELVGDVVQVAQVLRLAGEALLPVPLIQQFLGKRIAVGVALRVEAGARIAVPVPGPAQVAGGSSTVASIPRSAKRLI